MSAPVQGRAVGPDATRSIEAAVHAFYEVLSGRAGEERDWDRLRSLFAGGAAIVPGSVVHGTSEPAAVDLETYIRRFTEVLRRQDFFETGTIARLDVHGDIASVVSAYEARRTSGDGAPLKRGTALMHLVRAGDRWLLASMIWEDEG